MSVMGRPEDERVKIPALVHLTRLDYEYVSLKKGIAYDGDINIFVDAFRVALNRINAISLSETETQAIVQDFKVILGTDDLGRKFYNHLLRGYNGIKLIDFEHPERNTFQFATELPCINGNEEFRPDITILINGMPLAFVEVKRPNNMDGIQAEYDRMNKHVRNKKFRRFINITQLMVFSNNGEYDDSEAAPLEGAFYATASYNRLFFSHFREEDQIIWFPTNGMTCGKRWKALSLASGILPGIGKPMLKREDLYDTASKRIRLEAVSFSPP